jgi:protein gp37
MGETTGISWCDHTFNPWIGCTKVSEACRFCYAERDNAFRKWNGGTWGPGAPRKVTSEANWRKPLQWNHQAILDEVRRRVFCASLADVFDSEAPEDAQIRLFDLIEECSALDWLLLTKRPENALAFYRARYGDGPIPRNIWQGVSVENQSAFVYRVPILLLIRARVRFLSMEPLLGPVEFSDASRRADAVSQLGKKALSGIDWVITGGESGPNARPSHPDWFRSVRDQCIAAGVAYHQKQNGEWLHESQVTTDGEIVFIADHKPPFRYEDGFYRVGKKAAGRLLDGVEWNQFPEVRS